MRWRIYYGDNSTFSDRDGAPWEAPAINVQVCVYEQPPGAKPPLKIRQGNNVYVWRSDMGWIGVDRDGERDYLMLYKGIKALLFARTIPDKDFFAILKRAKLEGVG